ncbi:protein kinase/transcriptional regulator [Rhodococcus opacus PD630]|uniref:protein kinase domain-containing protein n=1 Tax=Rhodococcus opacus TaxID=37919 RepID=UPI00029CAEFE|nr:protein kinase [Rhodococcus opacus]AHK36118.1 Serine/threonine-protein kinase pknK [Rhodococcus opacus PD630]EHI43618.1 protein kinase/transcriptional regulator [Rhodococcus opacus PD630]UDH01255.1 protein kinase [Rhodococcus opacus PD630]
MGDVDPFATQRDQSGSVSAELAAAGFEDAQEIGRGGFGVVYRCRQVALDRIVAVKVLTADLDEQNRARFSREQHAAGRLTGHPNIVNVLHIDTTDNGRPFIVMPYYVQDSVDMWIRRHGPLPLEEALRLGVKMCGALETAHRLHILHRDVKPGNILFTDYGEPALTDFGIAHLTGGFETTSGVVTGSPAFTAPEVISGGTPTRAADVYGLGATLFAALTGHAAFERRSGEQVVAQFLRITVEPVPDPREHGIPEDVSAIIENAMSSDSRNRPSAAELGRQLRTAQHSHGFPVDEMALHTEPDATQVGTPPMHLPSSRTSDRGGQSRAPRDSARISRLPLELTSFVDRRTELAEAKNVLSSSRLVTLTGIGGAGKTRLAMQVATKMERAFVDGVILVELGELRDESLLMGVVASALGLRDGSARPLSEILVDFLQPRELLLVMDNCEQVVDAVAKLTEALLRVCPGLRILATSREPVGIRGEAVLPIPPLAVPDPDRLPRGLPRNDSVTLFAERGAAVVPGFELTEDNKVTIARICQRLDGLPLPIELAAARLRAMSPEQILQRLTDRFALLTHSSRDAPSRQQTLLMCIDWSHALCTPVEQRVWAELSVFAGSFDFDAAEHVCGGAPATMNLLDTVTLLVDKSILIREDSGAMVRFRMLETLREYGRGKAQQSGTFPELRRRHRDWYERLAVEVEADWISSRQLEWITRLGQDQPNLREALEFSVSDSPEAGLRIAGALLQFWLSQGLFSEGRRWFDRLLAGLDGEPTSYWAKAVYAGSVMAGLQGDLEAATALVEKGRGIADQTSDPVVRAHIDHAGGYVALFGGNPTEARMLLDKCVRVFAAESDVLFHVSALHGLGVAHELLNDTERAIESYERVMAITEARGESVYRSYSRWALAIAIWRQGDRIRAAHLLVQALRAARRVNDRLNASFSLQALAWIAADEQNTQRAVVLTAAAEQLSRSVGSPNVALPDMRVYQDSCDRRTREAMSDQAVAAARRKGAALSLDAAVAYAAGEQDSPRPVLTAGSSEKPTKREREVAELIAEGLTNKEIATRLVISPRTAQGHVEHLLAKLGFTSRAQIAAWIVGSQENPPPESPGH